MPNPKRSSRRPAARQDGIIVELPENGVLLIHRNSKVTIVSPSYTTPTKMELIIGKSTQVEIIPTRRREIVVRRCVDNSHLSHGGPIDPIKSPR
ncbi:MAG: hypothetical protein EXS36_02195 [Pedosphaera sp.]|nr:hypothetical protein [Pedosphaera sp.]